MTQKKTQNNTQTLTDRVEHDAKSSTDHQDDDLLSYVEHFVVDELKIPPMEPFSLMTPELASQALEDLSKTKEMLESKLKTIRALRHLLNSQK